MGRWASQALMEPHRRPTPVARCRLGPTCSMVGSSPPRMGPLTARRSRCDDETNSRRSWDSRRTSSWCLSSRRPGHVSAADVVHWAAQQRSCLVTRTCVQSELPFRVCEASREGEGTLRISAKVSDKTTTNSATGELFPLWTSFATFGGGRGALARWKTSQSEI